jgi:hypothetical protein
LVLLFQNDFYHQGTTRETRRREKRRRREGGGRRRGRRRRRRRREKKEKEKAEAEKEKEEEGEKEEPRDALLTFFSASGPDPLSYLRRPWALLPRRPLLSLLRGLLPPWRGISSKGKRRAQGPRGEGTTEGTTEGEGTNPECSR